SGAGPVRRHDSHGRRAGTGESRDSRWRPRGPGRADSHSGEPGGDGVDSIAMRPAALFLLLCAAAAAELPQGDAGPYRVTLRLPEGGLYAQEEMQIEFRVEDTRRPDPVTGFAAVVRAAPEATVDMPGMAKMPAFAETAHAEGVPGDYGIHPTF